jgi:hypothetical protein
MEPQTHLVRVSGDRSIGTWGSTQRAAGCVIQSRNAKQAWGCWASSTQHPDISPASSINFSQLSLSSSSSNRTVNQFRNPTTEPPCTNVAVIKNYVNSPCASDTHTHGSTALRRYTPNVTQLTSQVTSLPFLCHTHTNVTPLLHSPCYTNITPLHSLRYTNITSHTTTTLPMLLKRHTTTLPVLHKRHTTNNTLPVSLKRI